ncbi:pyruvate ferredoxin oxidoreductase, partial [Candidatus Falkowbacteria bacterium]|nr:pyruvate ferredoxin oxidoreductase [Candidatus Falkowbacteria bacterium]
IYLYNKAKKAIETKGPAVLNVFSPCIPNWKLQVNEALDISKLAVETCFWPLYEVVDGKYIINYTPNKKRPIKDFLMNQGRFKHLFDKGGEEIIDRLQGEVDRRWEELLKMAGD